MLLQLHPSCTRMELLVHLLEPGSGYVRVDLRRRDVAVSQHHLHAAQVGAVFEQVCGEGVTKDVRGDVTSDSSLPRVTNDLHPEGLTGHRPAAVGEEEMRI